MGPPAELAHAGAAAGGGAPRLTRIAVKSVSKIVIVPVASIVRLEAEDNYVRLWADRAYLHKETLTGLMARLDPLECRAREVLRFAYEAVLGDDIDRERADASCLQVGHHRLRIAEAREAEERRNRPAGGHGHCCKAALDLLLGCLDRCQAELRVRPCMCAERVSAGGDIPDDRRMQDSHPSYRKERGFYAEPVENIEDRARHRWQRPIIERQHDLTGTQEAILLREPGDAAKYRSPRGIDLDDAGYADTLAATRAVQGGRRCHEPDPQRGQEHGDDAAAHDGSLLPLHWQPRVVVCRKSGVNRT